MDRTFVYEPKTEGKLVLHTSGGDVNIALWPKAAPKACRNFLQLSADGYYDGSPFHRVLPGKLIQGGDPTGTGFGGSSSFGAPFADEFHGKLKFSHRGMLAMANDGFPDSNKSQFFITLGDCSWLNGKHTIFGKVPDASIFTLLDVAKTELGEQDRPLHPPTIERISILENPFPDIAKRAGEERSAEDPGKPSSVFVTKQKDGTGAPQAGRKQKNLLSFASEDEEEPSLLKRPNLPKKFSSAHEAFKKTKEFWDEEKISKGTAPQRRKEKRGNSVERKTESRTNRKNDSAEEKDDQKNAKETAALKEYKKLKNEMIKQKKQSELRDMGILALGKRKQKKPETALQRRSAKYAKKPFQSKEEREKDTLAKVFKFSRALHFDAKSFAKKEVRAEAEVSDEHSRNYWFGDGVLCFNKLPSHLENYKLDDYVVEDERTRK